MKGRGSSVLNPDSYTGTCRRVYYCSQTPTSTLLPWGPSSYRLHFQTSDLVRPHNSFVSLPTTPAPRPRSAPLKLLLQSLDYPHLPFTSLPETRTGS